MHVGLSSVHFFCQFAYNKFPQNNGDIRHDLSRCPWQYFCPFQRNTPAQNIMGDKGHAWLGLFQAMGLPGASKRHTIEKYGEGKGSGLKWPLFF